MLYGYTFEAITVTYTVAPHSYIATVTPPTCTDQGYTTYTCACGESYVDDYIDITEHDYYDFLCIDCGCMLWDLNGNGVLDILTIGNSHTMNYSQHLSRILTDMYADGLATKISFTSATISSIGLYSGRNSNPNATNRSHLEALGNCEGAYSYLTTNQYDLVIVQDYMESVVDDPEVFAEGLASFIREVNAIVVENGFKEPQIAWFADWVDVRSSGGDSALRDGEGKPIKLPVLTREEVYQKSVDNIARIESDITKGQADMPNFVIHASTIKQNAMSSYLGTSKLWENSKYCLLESDTTHLTTRLGTYLMGVGVLSEIINYYSDNLALGQSGVDVGATLTIKNSPPATGTDSQTGGKVNEEILAIISKIRAAVPA